MPSCGEFFTDDWDTFCLEEVQGGPRVAFIGYEWTMLSGGNVGTCKFSEFPGSLGLGFRAPAPLPHLAPLHAWAAEHTVVPWGASRSLSRAAGHFGNPSSFRSPGTSPEAETIPSGDSGGYG